MHDLNIYMLLDGLRTAEACDRDLAERLGQPDDSTDVGPGERLALCILKTATHDAARKFITEIVKRTETPLSKIARAAFDLQQARARGADCGDIARTSEALNALLAEAGLK